MDSHRTQGTLTFIESYDAPGRGPAGLVWDGRTLWLADYTAGRLFAIDPATGRAQANPLTCPGILSGLAWDGRHLWQGILDEGWLRSINPANNDFDQTLVVEEPGRLGGVAWDGRHLWAVSQEQGLARAIERETGKVQRQMEIPVAAGGLAYREGNLWLGYPEQMVFEEGRFRWLNDEPAFEVGQLELGSGRELARYAVDFLPLGLAWVGEELWLSSAATQKLYRAVISD